MSFCCCFRLGNSGLERSQPAKFVGRGEGHSGLVAPLCKALVESFQSMYRPTISQLQDMPKSEDKVYQMCIIYHPLVLALAIIILRIFSRFPATISSLSEVRSPLIFAHIRAAGPSGSSGAAAAVVFEDLLKWAKADTFRNKCGSRCSSFTTLLDIVIYYFYYYHYY